MHTHRHGERYIEICIYIYIYTQTDRQTDAAAAGQHVCEGWRGVLPLEDSLTAWFGVRDTSTDNKMNTNPKTSDTITQHEVTH